MGLRPDHCSDKFLKIKVLRRFLRVRRFVCASIAAATLLSLSALAQETPAPAAGAARAEGAPAGRRPPAPPAGPTPYLPNIPYLGANAGKPDFGGKGMWQVP